MKSGLTVTTDNSVAVLESLRQLSGMDVLVGIPADNAPRDDGAKLNNAEIGYLQSTGATIEIDGTTVTLPPRPFLDMGIEDSDYFNVYESIHYWAELYGVSERSLCRWCLKSFDDFRLRMIQFVICGTTKETTAEV